MVKESYCSFEVSQLLKEKGFNSPCMGRYSIRSKEFHLDCTKMCNNGGLFECAAPTHQMAMAWLREKKGIDCIIEVSDITAIPRKYYAIIWDIDDKSYIIDLFDSYEKAVEATLKYCLENLI